MPIPVISTPIADKTGRINEIWYRWFFEVSTRLDTLTSDLSALTTLVTPLEGAWTPVLEFGGDSTGIIYTKQDGRYIRQGNIVCVWMTLEISNPGSALGDARVSGLPYDASSIGDLIFPGSISDVNGTNPIGIPMCYLPGNIAAIGLFQFDNAAGTIDTIDDGDLIAGSGFSIQLTYRTED